MTPFPSRLALAGLAVAALLAGLPAAAAVSDFENLSLAPNSYFSSTSGTSFPSGAGTFDYNFTPFGGGCCWSGWTYSNVTDTTTAGFTNQYSAYAGSGAGGSANYGVAFFDFSGGNPAIQFAAPSVVQGGYFTNTTYAALSMRDGDMFAKKFGGASGNDPDYFKLTVIGKNAAGDTTGTADIFLADYRFADNAEDYVASTWNFYDLSRLGAVSRLEFDLEVSGAHGFAIGTPAYFALDNLTVTAVPEPSSLLLLLSGLAAVAGIARRRRTF